MIAALEGKHSRLCLCNSPRAGSVAELSGEVSLTHCSGSECAHLSQPASHSAHF